MSDAAVCSMNRYTFLVPILFSMASAQGNINARVDAKKQMLLQWNTFARGNPDLLQNKVFCLCKKCTTSASGDTLMDRRVLHSQGTAYSHRLLDVRNGLITKSELRLARGSLTYLTYEDFFRLYRAHLEGRVDKHGKPVDVHVEPAEEQHGSPVHHGRGGGHSHGQCQHSPPGQLSPGSQPSYSAGAVCALFSWA